MAGYEFRTAAVIGTGMMGPGIAATLALGGLRTTMVSRSAEGAARGLEKARGHIRVLNENGLTDDERAAAAREGLTASAEFDAVIPGADLVIESGPEKMEFKQEIFARMDRLTPPEAVLATNTSGLSVTAVAARCGRPERVLAAHFWNPPHLMPLVEIVKGERTCDEAAQAVRALLIHCGKVAVLVKKDRPGQLGNRLQHALWREAVNIVAEGIADAADVDLAAKTGFGLRLPVYGIFEHLDAVGVEMCTDIMHYIAQDLYNQPQAPPYLRDMIREGRRGARSGQGFYDWSKKDLKRVLERRDRFVMEFLRAHRPGESET
jgi:3-hydroxybutyryl-CoA dehydrogenase